MKDEVIVDTKPPVDKLLAVVGVYVEPSTEPLIKIVPEKVPDACIPTVDCAFTANVTDCPEPVIEPV